MAVRDLVIRVAGESGEGIQSTGILLAQATSRGGFHVITYWTVPAEIKGGHALFQVRLGQETAASAVSTGAGPAELFVRLLLAGFYLAPRGLGAIATPATDVDVDELAAAIVEAAVAIGPG